MSWKPCRSSGIMFDKADIKARRFRDEIDRIISQFEVIPFAQINYLSKCFYLYWLNDNKKSKALTGKSSGYTFEHYCPNYYLNMFKRNISLVYKPLQKIIQ